MNFIYFLSSDDDSLPFFSFFDWKHFVRVCAIEGRINYQKILSVDSLVGRSRHWGRSRYGPELLRSPVLTKGNTRAQGGNVKL